MPVTNRAKIAGGGARLCFLSLMLVAGVATAPTARGQTTGDSTPTFRWVHASTEPQLWREIRAAFKEELRPDVEKPEVDALNIYKYKYIERIGVLNQSALVFIGRRPQQEMPKENAWDQFHTAYNFSLATREKSEIEHASVMWMWKFQAVARLGPSRVPDVTFIYYSCTECEADLIFGALRFDEETKRWAVRSWGNGENAWWAVKQGLAVGGTGYVDGLFLYECVYKLLDSPIPGFQDVGIRCKQVMEDEAGDVNVDDATLRYGTRDGIFGPHLITDRSEIFELTRQICPPNAEEWLCKMPYAPSVAAGTKAFAAMFPQHADPTCWDLESFRVLKRGMLMKDFVQICGPPEEEIGSGVVIFVYYLTDGSVVQVRPTNDVGEIESAIHIQLNGTPTELLPAKPR